MSDAKIEQKIRAELEGVTSLESRFQIVGSMTQRTGLFFHNHKWRGVSVVPWEPDSNEMKIPLGPSSGGMYGIVANEEVAIRFDAYGRVSDVERKNHTPMDWDMETIHKLAFKDSDLERPWILNHVIHLGESFSMNGESISVHIPKEDGDWLGAIQIGVMVVGASQVVPEIRVDPDIGFVLLAQKGPVSYRPHLAGAYILQDDVNRTHKESLGLGADLKFVPELITEFSFLITLDSHDGVDIIVDFIPLEISQ